jgi:hypothetical protein
MDGDKMKSEIDYFWFVVAGFILAALWLANNQRIIFEIVRMLDAGRR